jgi:hypothetical protein
MAATLPSSSKKLSGGTASVAACGSLATATVTYTVTAGNVTAVAVSGLPAACNGAALSVTLVSAANADLGHAGPVTVAGQSASFPSLSASPATASVASARLAATGP